MLSDLGLIGKQTLEKEAAALKAFAEQLDSNFDKSCEKIFSCEGTIIISGMGKSGLVAKKWTSTLASTGTKAYFLNPADAQHGDLGLLQARDLLIALSYSGETVELDPVLRHAKDLKVFIIGVTGNPTSTLAKQSDLVLDVTLEEEACPLNLAPTTSSTLMIALGDALAVTLMRMRNFKEEDFAKLHPGGSLGRRLWLKVEDLMHSGSAMPLVESHQPFEEVLIEMTKKHLGIAIVMENKSVVGIITDGDLRRCFQKGLKSPNATQMMTAHPKTIAKTALAVAARQILEKHSIHHLIVVDDNEESVGVIHLDDLLKAKVL